MFVCILVFVYVLSECVFCACCVYVFALRMDIESSKREKQSLFNNN